jgi:D-alanyl-lipoteichoic acid acyltransferase DltB (MBOAT superfamily)
MLFNSFMFAGFFTVVFIAYWLLPHRFRWILLLVASYYFYMNWNAKYAALILTTTFVSYGCARLMEGSESRARRKAYMLCALIVCLGILAVFKYFNFFSESAAGLAGFLGLPVHAYTLKLLLPVGISFYTFQTLSYVIDVYHGKQKAERHLGIYALYVSYFPQLVAGPIERPQNLLPQIRKVQAFDYGQATYGLKLMALGYFKKLVIAASLASYADLVYADVTGFTGFALVLATGFFAVQIYCDFSGYSDIALGASKLMGIDLMVNFKTPYFSCSFKEFWNRWHISLSSWFRDYVYIPLGGSRCGKWKRRRNVMITFLLSGLWHGASWTFVIWGGLHGLYLLAEDFAREPSKKWNRGGYEGKKAPFIRFCKGIIVFALTCAAWIFFRSDTLSDAVYIMANMTSGISSPLDYGVSAFQGIDMGESKFLFVTFPILLLLIHDALSFRRDAIQTISRLKFFPRYAIYVFVLVVILIFSPKGMAAEFIYFQF